MSVVVFCKTYSQPPFHISEILRFAGCKNVNEDIYSVLHSCADEAQNKIVYKVCYCKLAVSITGNICDFGLFSVQSSDLVRNLNGCNNVILFAATVGLELDRLIAKYGRISPLKGLFLQAIGAERIETLCDTFCQDVAKEMNAELKPRFSPGYGDLPLELQKNVFHVLNCPKHIGLTLNDSLLMSPTKSVTAFIGLADKG